jgi:hypothetical protein
MSRAATTWAFSIVCAIVVPFSTPAHAQVGPAPGPSPDCVFNAERGELTVNRSVDVDVMENGEIQLSYVEPPPNPDFPGSQFLVLSCRDEASPEVVPTVTTVDALRVNAAELDLNDPLVPGRTTSGEGGSPEIEIEMRAGSRFLLWLDSATPESDGYVFGESPSGELVGNLNALAEDAGSADVDIEVSAGSLEDSVVMAMTKGGDDLISMAGEGLGGPVPVEVSLLQSDAGADTIKSGSGGVVMQGGADADLLLGGAGDDNLEPGGDGDVVDGGEGEDWVEFAEFGAPLRVDLSDTGPQDTGQGVVMIRAAEALSGTRGNDVLTGSNGPDWIDGEKGDDLVRGLAGDDTLTDEELAEGGRDRLYGGPGDDRISGWEGRDQLYGGSGDDRIVGGKHVDSLFGNGGLDRLLAVDPAYPRHKPAPDRRISCGAGDDAAESARTDRWDPRPLAC